MRACVLFRVTFGNGWRVMARYKDDNDDKHMISLCINAQASRKSGTFIFGCVVISCMACTYVKNKYLPLIKTSHLSQQRRGGESLLYAVKSNACNIIGVRIIYIFRSA